MGSWNPLMHLWSSTGTNSAWIQPNIDDLTIPYQSGWWLVRVESLFLTPFFMLQVKQLVWYLDLQICIHIYTHIHVITLLKYVKFSAAETPCFVFSSFSLHGILWHFRFAWSICVRYLCWTNVYLDMNVKIFMSSIWLLAHSYLSPCIMSNIRFHLFNCLGNIYDNFGHMIKKKS